MVNIKTGTNENGHTNSSPDIILRGKVRFGIGNSKTLTSSNGNSQRYKSEALKDGMLGGIKSTDKTIVEKINGSWYTIYNFRDVGDGTVEVNPIYENENIFLEVK